MKVQRQGNQAVVTNERGEPLTEPLPVRVAERVVKSSNQQRRFLETREREARARANGQTQTSRDEASD